MKLSCSLPSLTGRRCRLAVVTFLLCVTLIAFLVLALARHTRPMQDDFCRAVLVPEPTWSNVPPLLQRPGIAKMTALNYLNWSGRWAGVGLEILLLSTMPLPESYPYLVIALIATQLLLLFFSIRLITSDYRLAAYVTTLIVSVYWATMPSPQQGLFWIPGALE